jgi:hypothetical protein
MHSLEQALLRPAEPTAYSVASMEKEVLKSMERAASVAAMEKEVRKSMERAAFLLGRMRGQQLPRLERAAFLLGRMRQQQLRSPPPPPSALVSDSAQRIFGLTWNRFLQISYVTDVDYAFTGAGGGFGGAGGGGGAEESGTGGLPPGTGAAAIGNRQVL